MTRAMSRFVPAALALAVAAGAASAETLLPNFDPDKFVEGQEVDSKYFPLEAGRRAVLRARGVEDGERFTEKSVLTVLDRPGPCILGVRTTTQLDKAYEDGLRSRRLSTTSPRISAATSGIWARTSPTSTTTTRVT